MATTFRKLINTIYKETESLRRGYFSDESWENVSNIIKKIEEVIDNVKDNKFILNVYVKNGGYNYSSDLTSKYKAYELEIYDSKRQKTLNGRIWCNAAGTIEDPFKKYDICLTF